MITHTDQCGRQLFLAEVPQRIVSLVPSLTELLVDLGLTDKLVGITKFCVHPPGLKQEKTIVGGTKQVNFERVAQLTPDFILANKEENTAELVAELAAICPVYVSAISNIEDNIQLIWQLGNLLDCQDCAAVLVAEITKEAAHALQKMATLPVLSVVYLIWKNPWMVAGADTFISQMMPYIACSNSVSENRYPLLDIGAAVTHADAIFLASEPYPFKAQDIALIKSYYPKAKVILVDGEMFSWYGTRPLKAFPYFQNLREQLL